jgi:hypothetical protein
MGYANRWLPRGILLRAGRPLQDWRWGGDGTSQHWYSAEPWSPSGGLGRSGWGSLPRLRQPEDRNLCHVKSDVSRTYRLGRYGGTPDCVLDRCHTQGPRHCATMHNRVVWQHGCHKVLLVIGERTQGGRGRWRN